ncbi:MAG: hypothetical protein RR945_03175 [Erysipelotrichaceae bacterium]
MINHKYDYDRSCFLKIYNKTDEYYLKINGKYIKVSEQVFKVCRSSYDKIRKEEKNKVDRSIFNYEDIDQSTFFVVNEEININIVYEIYLKDIAKRIKKEIFMLSERDRKIATCIFIEEYSDRETSRLLHIPQTTVTYRKKIIREKIKNNIEDFCSIDE